MDVEVFSFFSGLGFLDLGFENAGFNIVFVNEYNEQFLKAYQYARRYNGHIPAYGYSHKDMQREKIEVDQHHKDRLESFVKLYSIFDNDMDLTGKITDPEKTLFDWLKKYKLASSEGLNKHTNRMIRYNVMKDFLFSLTGELEAAQITLYEKMRSNSTDDVAEDPEE